MCVYVYAGIYIQTHKYICVFVCVYIYTYIYERERKREREEEMATHSSILAWEIAWAEEPGGLQSMGSQKVGPRLSN